MTTVSNILVLGKYLDQPKLIHALNEASTKVLIGGAAGYGFYNTFKAPENERTKQFIKNALVLGFTVGSALLCLKGLKINGKRIFHGILSGHHHGHSHKKPPELINEFVSRHAGSLDDLTKSILEKAKKKILSLSEIKKLYSRIPELPDGKAFLKKLIPDPHAHGYKEILKEIKNLSLLGLIPVTGGITGGILGDIITEKHWKPKIKDKVKEGFYQYIANIFLCNVGAGLSLFAMDKMGIQSKPVKLAGMLGGIAIAGLVFGSMVANYISKKIINPVFEKGFSGAVKDLFQREKEYKEKINLSNINNERHPEFLDAILHLDDVATAGFLAGFKWIESVLPIFYSISAYRAGMGYRNGHSHFHRNETDSHKSSEVSFREQNRQYKHRLSNHHWKNFDHNKPFTVFEQYMSKTPGNNSFINQGF